MSRPKPTESRRGHASTTPTLTRSTDLVLTPDPPESLDSKGVELWNTVWSLGNGLYKETDYWVIERWADMQSRRHHLLSVIKSEGMMTVGSTGQPVVHPALKMVDAIEGRLPNLEAVLALTPESRARLGLQAIETQSKLDAFLSKGGATA